MVYDAVIVGAGHNGLVAAAYLSRAGRRVCVLECHETIGGASVSEHPWTGWTVSAASYVCSLLHPDIIADLDLASHGYAAYRKAAASFTPLLDGRSLLLSRDDDANAREIAAGCLLGSEILSILVRRKGAVGDAFYKELDITLP